MARPVIDIRKDLNKSIGNITSAPLKAVDSVCCIAYSAYKAIVNTLMMIAGPSYRFKENIINGFQNVSTDALNTLDKNVNKLVANVPQIILPNFMDPKAAALTSLFNDTCLDFSNSFPPELVVNISAAADTAKLKIAETLGINPDDPSLFDNSGMDIVDMMMDANTEIIELLKMPVALTNEVIDQIDKAKDSAIDEIFGELADTISKPLRFYEDYMKSLGVADMIKKLETFEKCLTKKGLCGKKLKDIQEPVTKKTYSRYFAEAFMIDGKGRVKITKIITDDRAKLKKSVNLKKKLDLFKYDKKPTRSTGLFFDL
jgi:hypothetical protein